ncbi:MAG: hypothetical protein EZS28_006435 [Streblomastix strix]|uniref:Uncharacterized protein n=1 Tax=Streblomastix strix TaxID=222440 RepID=A0A5J4WSW8_9EUKA|nr:MAG: hypothetical protein EZS28_006435 [Streblomastix strix]
MCKPLYDPKTGEKLQVEKIEKDKMWEKEKQGQLKELESRNRKDKAEFETTGRDIIITIESITQTQRTINKQE